MCGVLGTLLQSTLAIKMYRFHKIEWLVKLSLYPERFTEGTGIIGSMGSNCNKEDIVITRVDCVCARMPQRG